MRTRKIDFYVVKEVLSPFLGSIFFFAFVFLLFQMLRLAEELIVNNAPFGLIMKLLWTLIVGFLPLGIPIAFLVGVLFAFARFSGDSELVAMKAGGMSLPRIAVPVFTLSIAVAGISVLLNMDWAPWSEVAMRNTMMKIGNRKFASSISEGTFTSGFFNLLLYTEKSNNRAGKMEKVFIFDERDPKHPLTVVSKTGELIRVQSNEDDLGGLVMHLQDGSIHQTDMSAESYNKVKFGNYQIYFDIPDTTGKFGYKPRMFGFDELKQKMKNPANTIEYNRELNTELWRRFSIALSPILFVLLGIGFATVRTRGARSGVLLIAFLTMGVYWQVQVSAIYLGEQGVLPPWLAMEVPNLLVLLAGGIAFRKASW